MQYGRPRGRSISVFTYIRDFFSLTLSRRDDISVKNLKEIVELARKTSSATLCPEYNASPRKKQRIFFRDSERISAFSHSRSFTRSLLSVPFPLFFSLTSCRCSFQLFAKSEEFLVVYAAIFCVPREIDVATRRNRYPRARNIEEW